MHAEKCPICNGDGVTFPRDEGHYSIGYKVTCYGCGGLGWVQVADEFSCELSEYYAQKITDGIL